MNKKNVSFQKSLILFISSTYITCVHQTSILTQSLERERLLDGLERIKKSVK